jgi:hypothetical protein
VKLVHGLAFQRFGASPVSAPHIVEFGQHMNKMPSPAGRKRRNSRSIGRRKVMWLTKS